nr:nitrilase [Kordiimonadales bacterium]
MVAFLDARFVINRVAFLSRFHANFRIGSKECRLKSGRMKAMDDGIKAAVVQAGSAGFETQKSLGKLADLASDAARGGAELVVFPEAFIGGYPKGIDFGTRLGSRSPEGRDQFRRYHEAAIDLPGPAVDRMAEIASDCGLYLVVGVIERAGGTLYCTSLVFGPDGRLLAKHRKLMPTAMERLIWGQGDGSTMEVVPTPIGRIGMAICWENYMPLYRSHLYAQGVTLYCAPTVDEREEWQASMRHIALEGRCFVLSACQHLKRRDLPDDFDCREGNDPETTLINGGSVIISPLGKILAGPVYGEDAVLLAYLDRGDLARGKFDLDVAGHYARPDIFRLIVDDGAKS